MTKRIRSVGVTVIAIITIANGISCGKRAPEGAPLEVSGVIEAIQTDIRSQSQGPVEEILVREGQKVAKGDLLCRINADKLRIQMDQVKANIAGAEAALALARKGTKKELIAVAKSQVDLAAKNLEIAQKDQERLAKLYSQDAVSASQKDRTDLALKAAQEQSRSAQESYDMALRGSEKEQIDMAEAGLKALRAQEKLFEDSLNDTEVRAPGPGLVEVRHVEVGELVGAGSALFSLVDLSRTYVKAYVPENAVGRLQLGGEVEVACDSFPGRTFQGTIGFISEEAEFAPKNVQTKEERLKLVYMIKSDLPNPDGALKPGMPVDVRIVFK
jgi:HlyD family secretion protein